jgi:hypothetical protein
MIFQFGIVAIGAICATVLAALGQSDTAKYIIGGCVFVFVMSML